jgi:hypothetical protein
MKHHNRHGHQRTRDRSNFNSRGLLKDRKSYRAGRSALDLKTIKTAGRHRSPFGRLIDSLQSLKSFFSTYTLGNNAWSFKFASCYR